MELDERSFYIGRHVGEIKAWCVAAKNGFKELGLSDPFKPEDYRVLLPYMEEEAARYGVSYRLEEELPTTDLFPDMDLTGFWVFLIYKKPEVIEAYDELKSDYERLIREGGYVGEARREIAVRFGRLLGYSEESIHVRWS